MESDGRPMPKCSTCPTGQHAQLSPTPDLHIKLKCFSFFLKNFILHITLYLQMYSPPSPLITGTLVPSLLEYFGGCPCLIEWFNSSLASFYSLGQLLSKWMKYYRTHILLKLGYWFFFKCTGLPPQILICTQLLCGNEL